MTRDARSRAEVATDEDIPGEDERAPTMHGTACSCPGGLCIRQPHGACAGCGRSPISAVLRAGDHSMSLCGACLAVALDGRRADQPPLQYLWGAPPPTSEPTSPPVAAVPTPEEVAQRWIDDLVQAALFLDAWDAGESLTVRSVPRRSARQRHQRPASATSATQAELLELLA